MLSDLSGNIGRYGEGHLKIGSRIMYHLLTPLGEVCTVWERLTAFQSMPLLPALRLVHDCRAGHRRRLSTNHTKYFQLQQC